MATEKAALRITELDFDSIRENLKTYLRSQSEFQDFDFEGSGMSVLLDILAYNTHYMGYYLNMVGNEMFLDSAQLRSSVLSHAKLINYIPASKQGALSKISVRVTPSQSEDPYNNNPSVLTLGKYTRLLGYDKDGVNYPFVTLYSNTAVKSSGSFTFSNVSIKQGEVVSLQFLMDENNISRRFEIPSANVDITSLIVSVQDSIYDSNTTVYRLVDNIVDVGKETPAYFIEENENQNYTFYFGDDIVGKRPKNGSVIVCTYLDNVGSIANNITGFTFTDPIGEEEYRDNVSVTNVVSSFGGSDKETVEQAKFRAPYFYTTQNRAVTKNDYMSLLVKDYNYIEAISVWGGEENDPIVYGKVFLSIKTKGNYELTNFEKEVIKQDLIQKRNVLTVTPEIVDPDYVYIGVKGTIYFDSTLTDKKPGEILELVKAAIEDYSNDELNQFDSIFRKSKLLNYIESCDNSITSSDIDIFVQKRTRADITNIKKYEIVFQMPLEQRSHIDKLYSFPGIQIYDANGNLREVFIEEVPEAETGIDSIRVIDGGKNYTVAPTVNILGDGTGAKAKAFVLSGKVNKIQMLNKGRDYSKALVTLSGGDGTGAQVEASLQIGVGLLRLVYFQPNGQKVVFRNNVGTIDYQTGNIVLNDLRIVAVSENDYYDDDYFTLNIVSASDVIKPLRNRILTIDLYDPKSIRLEVVSE